MGRTTTIHQDIIWCKHIIYLTKQTVYLNLFLLNNETKWSGNCMCVDVLYIERQEMLDGTKKMWSVCLYNSVLEKHNM